MSATDEGYLVALEEMRQSLDEGGIPVGGCVVSKDGKIMGRGRNMRMQNGSPVLHGETSAFDNARQYPSSAFEGCTVYTTLSPCPMCAGAMIWFKTGKVVIGENTNMSGREELLKSHGIEVVILNEPKALGVMTKFIETEPEKWKGV
ncbi:putative cytosine deaminase [Polychaeton citri CBS 116435]|uniref:Cytosine deaminase n=1 Tax=Polychaeton citri CBS 116435 TaxID=1314669 RepID=A0A9P4UQL4_9PEZI|nr:putative cytosine deaminase [Polychaeton citri CBS 116435]